MLAELMPHLQKRNRELAAEVRRLRAERDRFRLESIAFSAQLAAFLHAKHHPRINGRLRAFLVRLSKRASRWVSLLHVVQPRTIILWHRHGSRYWWRWRSRHVGRPKLDAQVAELVVKLARANPLWGAPRIHGELAKLGIRVSERTVSRLMPKVPTRPGSKQARQRWRTFLANHLPDIAAIDFFTVPTVAFRVLYGFVVLDLGRRRILHINATEHPTAEWTAQQIVEAFPGSVDKRFLLRDRDGIYGHWFRRRVKGLGLREILCSPQSPWRNGYVERLIGSIRRECLDHVIVLNERHLLRIMGSYVEYHNAVRTHLSLNKDPPLPRPVQGPRRGRCIVEIPHLGGLHHHYERRAA